MLFTTGRGATGGFESPAARRLATSIRSKRGRPLELTRIVALLGSVGWLACGATPPTGTPANTGGAAGSSSIGGDASLGDARGADGPAPDSSNVDGTPPRDAAGTMDGTATSDARDSAFTTDTAGDRAADAGASDGGSIDGAMDSRAIDGVSMDVAIDASIDVGAETGPSDGGACGCTAYGTPTVAGTEPSSLTELSGIVASRQNPGVLYAHNDSGSNSTLVVLSDVAAPLGQIVLSNVAAVDWEDVAVGPCDAGSCVFVGEIGDNNLAYASRAVYRFAEPTISPTTPIGTQMVTADALTFVYPDGRHNAETLLVEPMSGDIFVVTKVSNVPSTVYRMPKPFTPGTQVTMEKVGDLSLPGSAGLVTGGDVHPCGTRMLIRTYPMIYEFKLGAGQPFSSIFASPGTPVATPTQDQESKGEGVTYAADGVGYFTASELDGKSTRSLFRVRCQ